VKIILESVRGYWDSRVSLFGRTVRRAWWGNGEAVLSKVPRHLRAKVVASSPHRWCILRYRVSTHVVHGSSRVPAQTSCQPVCCQVLSPFDSVVVSCHH